MDKVEMKVDAASLRRLLGKSSQFPNAQKNALRRRLREAAQETRDAVQEAARQPGVTQSAEGRHTGLRERIASGTRVTVMAGSRRAGVQIVTRGSLARAWESKRGWRHPVYGTRAKWVQQVGHPGYFSDTIWGRRNQTRRAVEQAMQDTLKTMGGAR